MAKKQEIKWHFNIMKYIRKKKFSFFAFTLMALLFLEIGAFGLNNYLQPSYREVITDKVQKSQAPNGGYYIAINSNQVSLSSTYAALHINLLLNNTKLQNNTNIMTYIMSQYDTKTGLFYNHDNLSLSATYSAIESLSFVHDLDLINSSKTINSILDLKTKDSLFHDVSATNNISQSSIGELDHLFQAVSILKILYNNQSDFYSALNRTQILYSLLNLQQQGGFKEKITDSFPNMRNAYYVSQIVENLGFNLSTFETIGFKPSSLINWIRQMYTGSGFIYNQNSVPSVEATAYALITLLWLGLPPDILAKQYGNSFGFMVNALGASYINGPNILTLDSMNDVLIALKSANSLNILNQSYLKGDSQMDFLTIIAFTSILLILFIILTIIQVFKEDESNYYETALKMCLKEVYENKGDNLERLSYLLGEKITKITFTFQDFDQSLAHLRAQSEEHEFIIQFETFSWFPKELTKYDLETRQALNGFNFLDKDVLYTIEEALQALHS